MLTIEPCGDILCATLRGADLSKPLSDADIGTVLIAIGRHGMVRFPGQELKAAHLRDFAAQFGEVQKVNGFFEPEMPEVSVLSNMIENGKPVGYADAGPIWHRDMTYCEVPGFANILYGLKVPMRGGKALGATRFLNTGAVYDDLPDEVKRKLKGTVGVHNGQHYAQKVQGIGHQKDEAGQKRHSKPPTRHPLLLTHPVTGKTILYLDSGHVERIEGLPEKEGADLLQYLIEFQERPEYEYSFHWTQGDVLMWDNLTSLHRSTIDYGADEHRLIKRSQVLGDSLFDPAFLKPKLESAKAVA